MNKLEIEQMNLQKLSLEEATQILHRYTLEVFGDWGVAKSLSEILGTDTHSEEARTTTFAGILLKICDLLDQRRVDYGKFWNHVDSGNYREGLAMIAGPENREDSSILVLLLLRNLSLREHSQENKEAIQLILKDLRDRGIEPWKEWESYFSPTFMRPVLNAFMSYELDLEFLTKARDSRYPDDIFDQGEWNEMYFKNFFEFCLQNGGKGLPSLISKIKILDDLERIEFYITQILDSLENTQNEENKYEILSAVLDILYSHLNSKKFVEKILVMVELKILNFNERYHQYFLYLLCAKIYKNIDNNEKLIPMIEACFHSIEKNPSNFQRSVSYSTLASEFSKVLGISFLEKLFSKSSDEIQSIEDILNRLLALLYLSMSYLVNNREEKNHDAQLKIKEIILQRGNRENIKETLKCSYSLLSKFNQKDLIYFLSIEFEKCIDWEYDFEYTTIEIIDFLIILENFSEDEKFKPLISKCLQTLITRENFDDQIFKHFKKIKNPINQDKIYNYIIKNIVKNRTMKTQALLNLFSSLPYNFPSEKKKEVLDRIFLNLRVQRGDFEKIQCLFQLLKIQPNPVYREEILRFTLLELKSIDFIRVYSNSINEESIRNYFDSILILQKELPNEEISSFLKRKFFNWNDIFYDPIHIELFNILLDGFKKKGDIEKQKSYLQKIISIIIKEKDLLREPYNLLFIHEDIERLLEKSDQIKIYQLLVQTIKQNSPGYTQYIYNYTLRKIKDLENQEVILFYLQELRDTIESLQIAELNYLLSYSFLRIGKLDVFFEIWEREINKILDSYDFCELESVIIDTLSELALQTNLEIKIQITGSILEKCEKFMDDMNRSLGKILFKILEVFSGENNREFLKKYIPIFYKKSQDIEDIYSLQILIFLCYLDSSHKELYLNDFEYLLQNTDVTSISYTEILGSMDRFIEFSLYREFFDRIENIFYAKESQAGPDFETAIFFAGRCFAINYQERGQFYLKQAFNQFSLNSNDRSSFYMFIQILDLYFISEKPEKYIEFLTKYLYEPSTKNKLRTGEQIHTLLQCINKHRKYELYGVLEDFFFKSSNLFKFNRELSQLIREISIHEIDERILSFYMRSMLQQKNGKEIYITVLVNLIKILISSGFTKEAEDISFRLSV